MAATKVPYRRELGTFSSQQAQLQGQAAVSKVNQHVDAIRVLNNRAYAALAVNSTIATAVAYATLLSTNITTILERGFLIVTFTASGRKTTAAGSAYFRVLIDGVATKACYVGLAVNFPFNSSIVVRVAVTRGTHVVALQWRTDVSSLQINAATVAEEHAHMLVQEAA